MNQRTEQKTASADTLAKRKSKEKITTIGHHIKTAHVIAKWCYIQKIYFKFHCFSNMIFGFWVNPDKWMSKSNFFLHVLILENKNLWNFVWLETEVGFWQSSLSNIFHVVLSLCVHVQVNVYRENDSWHAMPCLAICTNARHLAKKRWLLKLTLPFFFSVCVYFVWFRFAWAAECIKKNV